MVLNFIKICPRCKIASGNYHLMMRECDNCVNEIANNKLNNKDFYYCLLSTSDKLFKTLHSTTWQIFERIKKDGESQVIAIAKDKKSAKKICEALNTFEKKI